MLLLEPECFYFILLAVNSCAAASFNLTPVICSRPPELLEYCTVLYCTVLYCNVLYCTVLYCTVLYCTVLYCTVLYCTVLYCTVLYCTVYCTVMYCTVLYCTAGITAVKRKNLTMFTRLNQNPPLKQSCNKNCLVFRQIMSFACLNYKHNRHFFL